MNREPERPNADRAARQLDRHLGFRQGLAAAGRGEPHVLGKRFMVTAFVFFAIGGVLAMLIRAQLATPIQRLRRRGDLQPDLHDARHVMMFLFAIPMLEGGDLHPAQDAGRARLAFPRLTAFGYWCYLFGGTIIIVAMLAGVAPDSGWFMYTPLSSRVPFTPGINADVWLLGITFVEISAVCAAVEITVSILKMRAPGMSLDKDADLRLVHAGHAG
jgi:cytochrome c oxidase subunit I+III